MKLAEFEFVYSRDNYGTIYMCEKEESAFCADGVLGVLRRVFKLPKKLPKRLWLTLHSRATAFREKLRVYKIEETDAGEINEKATILRRENGSVFCNCDDIDDLIYPFIGQIVYLQVEYEE